MEDATRREQEALREQNASQQRRWQVAELAKLEGADPIEILIRVVGGLTSYDRSVHTRWTYREPIEVDWEGVRMLMPECPVPGEPFWEAEPLRAAFVERVRTRPTEFVAHRTKSFLGKYQEHRASAWFFPYSSTRLQGKSRDYPAAHPAYESLAIEPNGNLRFQPPDVGGEPQTVNFNAWGLHVMAELLELELVSLRPFPVLPVARR